MHEEIHLWENKTNFFSKLKKTGNNTSERWGNEDGSCTNTHHVRDVKDISFFKVQLICLMETTLGLLGQHEFNFDPNSPQQLQGDLIWEDSYRVGVKGVQRSEDLDLAWKNRKYNWMTLWTGRTEPTTAGSSLNVMKRSVRRQASGDNPHLGRLHSDQAYCGPESSAQQLCNRHRHIRACRAWSKARGRR